jgi:hypothetical protein
LAPGDENLERNNPNICASKSENSLKTIGDTLTHAITSPSAAAKEIVLSPFSKLAKGDVKTFKKFVSVVFLGDAFY